MMRCIGDDSWVTDALTKLRVYSWEQLWVVAFAPKLCGAEGCPIYGSYALFAGISSKWARKPLQR